MTNHDGVATIVTDSLVKGYKIIDSSNNLRATWLLYDWCEIFDSSDFVDTLAAEFFLLPFNWHRDHFSTYLHLAQSFFSKFTVWHGLFSLRGLNISVIVSIDKRCLHFGQISYKSKQINHTTEFNQYHPRFRQSKENYIKEQPDSARPA